MPPAARPTILYDLPYAPGLTLDVHRPHDDLGELLPTLLYLHAGAALGDDKTSDLSYAWCRALAAQGCAVLAVNTSPWPAWPRNLLDARAALEFVWAEHRRVGADSRLTGAVGVADGATLALLLGLVSPEEVAELAYDAGIVPERSLTPRVRVVVNVGGRVDLRAHESDDDARRRSPIAYVTPGRRLPWLLSIHGTEDDVVPESHPARLHETLLALGEDHELWRVHGAGHAFGPVVGRHDLGPPLGAWLRRTLLS